MYRNKIEYVCLCVCVYVCSILGSLGMEHTFSVWEEPDQHVVGIYVPPYSDLSEACHILKPIRIIFLVKFIWVLGWIKSFILA